MTNCMKCGFYCWSQELNCAVHPSGKPAEICPDFEAIALTPEQKRNRKIAEDDQMVRIVTGMERANPNTVQLSSIEENISPFLREKSAEEILSDLEQYASLKRLNSSRTLGDYLVDNGGNIVGRVAPKPVNECEHVLDELHEMAEEEEHYKYPYEVRLSISAKNQGKIQEIQEILKDVPIVQEHLPMPVYGQGLGGNICRQFLHSAPRSDLSEEQVKEIEKIIADLNVTGLLGIDVSREIPPLSVGYETPHPEMWRNRLDHEPLMYKGTPPIREEVRYVLESGQASSFREWSQRVDSIYGNQAET